MLLTFFTVFPNSDNRQLFESCLGFVFIILYIGFFYLKKIHWSAQLAFLICALNGLIFYYQPGILYSRPLPMDWCNSIQNNMALALVYLFLLSWFGSQLSEINLRYLVLIFFFIAILDSIWIIGRSLIFDFSQAYSLMSNSAIDASFLVCMLPFAYAFAIKDKIPIFKYFPVFLIITAVLFTQSSTGYGGLGIATAGFFLVKYREKGLALSLGLAPIIGLISKFLLKEELLNPNGRYGIWKISLDFLFNECSKWKGAGFGTFWFWGPATQIHYKQIIEPHFSGKMDIFTWMHNDWLQIFFELGILGIISILILYGFILWRTWKDKSIFFPVACTYGFIALTQMPLRVFVLQLLGIVIIRYAFSDKKILPMIHEEPKISS